MILADSRFTSALQDLWSVKSFRVSIFFAIAHTIAAMLVGYLAMDSTHPYEFLAERSYIVPPESRGGDQIIVNWSVVHNRTCPGTVERQLMDPETGVVLATYDIAPAAFNGEVVGPGRLSKTFTLPKSIQPGWIGYQAKLAYTCNWVQDMFPDRLAIRYTTPRLLFKVEP